MQEYSTYIISNPLTSSSSCSTLFLKLIISSLIIIYIYIYMYTPICVYDL